MWDTEGGARSNFRPEVHGFRFANRFAWPGVGGLWALAGATLRRVGVETAVLGLCGGMCLAALDLFYTGRAVPDDAVPPAPGSALFRYLLRRQIDSYAGLRVPARVLAWMWRRDARLDGYSIAEFLHLRARLNGGTPTPLVLVRARGLSDPTVNHQVLAVGYDWEPRTRRATIHLYDPNHPLIEPTLSFTLAPGERIMDLRQSTGEPVRGFFLGRYRHRRADLPG